MHGHGEAARQISPVLAVGGRALDDLVVDVGDIAHVGHLIAQRAQVALHQVESHQHARMTHMDVVVVGHAADVHADFIAAQRLEFLLLAA